MNLILLQKAEVDADGRAVLSDDRARHIRKILKAEPGKQLRVGLLDGPFGTGTVESMDGTLVVVKCEFDPELPPIPRIDLLLAMPRPKVMKRLWAQLAALGTGRIVLLRAEKVERYYFDSHVIEPGFYNKMLVEGLQQARCTHLPEVLVRPLFKPFVEDELEALFPDHLKLLADPAGTKRLSEIQDLGAGKRVLLAIGPEGGWTPYELEMLQARGFRLFGMGNRILRTDTATVGLISMIAEQVG
ncbi:16S rRNA (uracil(1498)-N(3))-methyltransferase [Pontiella sp.]|uniref:16S rRNA (uracil(1498)-N(3))-methyltransferase n=1 Tax=Pontiella sp. TaxID=2837462 RepID=UPI0035648E9E